MHRWFLAVTCTPACRNGGTCHVNSSSAHCDCPSGYTGDYCQYQGDYEHKQKLCVCAFVLYLLLRTYILPFPLVACNPSCQNGGSCIAGSCVCPREYNGSYCQHSSFNNCECVCSECLCICACLCEVESEAVLTSACHSPLCLSS